MVQEGVVKKWLAPEELGRICGNGVSAVERIGREWLVSGGKRWRPLLTVSVFQALGGKELGLIQPVAVAVECFHKASLIHDDIEDNDSKRYGAPTVHARYGVPAAINAGDWLIGEGYRLLAEAPFGDAVRAELVRAAVQGHRELCVGQGEELAYCMKPGPVTLEQVERLYAKKTSSAFEVAVQVGAIAAGADSATRSRLSEFTRIAGVAYQIKDDREDFQSTNGRAADLLALRPTIYLALACEASDRNIRDAVEGVWGADREGRQRLIDKIAVSEIPELATSRLSACKDKAREVLAGFTGESGRVLSKLLNRVLD